MQVVPKMQRIHEHEDVDSRRRCHFKRIQCIDLFASGEVLKQKQNLIHTWPWEGFTSFAVTQATPTKIRLPILACMISIEAACGKEVSQWANFDDALCRIIALACMLGGEPRTNRLFNVR